MNLPAAHKMCDPQYQTLTGDKFPFIQVKEGVKAKVIAGEIKGVAKAPINPIQPIEYIDFELKAGSEFTQMVNLETAILYCYQGEGKVKNGSDSDDEWVSIKRKSTLYFHPEDGNAIHFKADAKSDVSLLLLAGKPIKEVNSFIL